MLGTILEQLDNLRLDVSRELDPQRRVEQGQFFTPPLVARLMASFFGPLPGSIRLLDPGAGIGSLTAAFIDETLSNLQRPDTIQVTAYETDADLLNHLRKTMDLCAEACERHRVRFTHEIIAEDFISECRNLSGGLFARARRTFNCVIMNPPYRKIAADSEARRLLRSINVETGNLYTAFMAVAVQVLEFDGQFVAITPRSFCNGTYFAPFRSFFLHRMSLRRIHIFESRKSAFSDDNVLQENIILRADNSYRKGEVVISSSVDAATPPSTERRVRYEDVVHPEDTQRFIRIPTDSLDSEVADWMHSLPFTADQLGVQVSTGRVVDFRAQAHVRSQPVNGTVPLIYPMHVKDSTVIWPKDDAKKPNAIVADDVTADLLVPGGVYVLVKRFTAKEERRRVVAALCDSTTFWNGPIGIENHLNYLHQGGKGLSLAIAKGLVAYLNSSIFDQYFRQFSGHTQVNATDLRKMRFPSVEKLTELGKRVNGTFPEQTTLDNLCREVVFDMAKDGRRDPARARNRIQEALKVLEALDMPREQRNERSALALLALLGLKPETPWSQATRPMLGITQMMDYFRDVYGKKYAPNTRETVRRQTIHQFEQAELVESNPDEPDRPINSPHWCYQISSRTHGLLQSFGSPQWKARLKAYSKSVESLRSLYAHEREMTRVPVKIAEGLQLFLSAGKHNELVRAVVKEFWPRFAAGGKPLYVGDTHAKWAYADEEALAAIGIAVGSRGKLPDVIVFDEKRGWLFLIEAVTSHGPVSPKRQRELQTLFKKCEKGIVFVTAFPTRAVLKKYMSDISWETEVWVAESPTHLIHFDGERFLGPYPETTVPTPGKRSRR